MPHASCTWSHVPRNCHCCYCLTTSCLRCLCSPAELVCSVRSAALLASPQQCAQGCICGADNPAAPVAVRCRLQALLSGGHCPAVYLLKHNFKGLTVLIHVVLMLEEGLFWKALAVIAELYCFVSLQVSQLIAQSEACCSSLHAFFKTCWAICRIQISATNTS